LTNSNPLEETCNDKLNFKKKKYIKKVQWKYSCNRSGDQSSGRGFTINRQGSFSDPIKAFTLEICELNGNLEKMITLVNTKGVLNKGGSLGGLHLSWKKNVQGNGGKGGQRATVKKIVCMGAGLGGESQSLLPKNGGKKLAT